MTDLTAETKTALLKLGVKPEKRRGQNFMIRTEELDFLAASLGAKEGETVVEIGPGLGHLTRALISLGLRVVAVEMDTNMARHLSRAFEGAAVEIKTADVLKTDLAELSGGKPLKVIGNIPYNITSPIVEWLIHHRRHVDRAVLTMQMEVAERIGAGPGNKQWGPLSLFAQFYADVEMIRPIGRAHFFPSPDVDSAAVRFDFLKTPRFDVDEKLFFKIARSAFQQRRKMLMNGLLRAREGNKVMFDKDFLVKAFQKSAIDPRRRPETLTLREWASLTISLSK